MGTVTHQAVQVDRVERPEFVDDDQLGDDGDYWEEGLEYKCNYALGNVA